MNGGNLGCSVAEKLALEKGKQRKRPKLN